jgi:hypothetical protein
MSVRGALGAFLLAAGLLAAPGASASTIYTYTFEQSGYLPFGTLTSAPGKITGSFTGRADATGVITQDSLTSFHIEMSGFTDDLLTSNLTGDFIPDFFGYHVGDTPTFGFIEQIAGAGLPINLRLCVGPAATLACVPGTERGVLLVSIFPLASSAVTPVLTQVSVTNTPIPGAVVLLATALSGMLCLRRLRGHVAA